MVGQAERGSSHGTLNDAPPRRDDTHPARWPVLRQIVSTWRWCRRLTSRREWTVRLLDLEISRGTSDEPGLILLQIDGLARTYLERAIEKGHLPFLRSLIRREGYRIETLYSGQPATTPSVLGELYYGVPHAVPSWAFRDHRTGQIVEMMQPTPAATIQDELAAQGEGLLDGGSAYCTIYTGGARESVFCPGGMRWSALDAAAWKKAAVFLLNIASVVRILAMSVLEFFVASWDVIAGKLLRREFVSEIAFVLRRVIGAVIMREVAAIGAEVDATRGLPVIHANFLGYDEQAHRRGPNSRLALWSLRGIDHVLKRIWNAAQSSRRRDYRVWIMSDHGQQRTIPYQNAFCQTLGDAISTLYQTEPGPAASATSDAQTNVADAASVSRKLEEPPTPAASAAGSETPTNEPTVVAVGPIGYIYWPHRLSSEETDRIARRIVSEAMVPTVMARIEDEVFAWTPEGRFAMPAEADRVLAPDHPHLPDVAEDLTQLCSHPDAGDFLVSGWRNDGLPYSYVCEHGAHGGPGPEETSGFLLLPPDAPAHADKKAVRPVTLRQMARRALRRELHPRGPLLSVRPPGTLRLVTYNVHSCIGLDGRMSMSRIARTLAGLDPDVIALQELDVRRRRTGGVDQAEAIARLLEMQLHFHPSFDVEEERFGNAILSRLPMSLVKAGPLPSGPQKSEPRGALWVRIETGSQSLDLITTHLGTSRRDRAAQVEALLGKEWLANPAIGPHAVLCGDFNAMPGSRAYEQLAAELHDAQQAPGKRPQRTWFGPFPLTRIDHVFTTGMLRVLHSSVLRNRLSCRASDHLPLVVDLELKSVPVEPGADSTSDSAAESSAPDEELAARR